MHERKKNHIEPEETQERLAPLTTSKSEQSNKPPYEVPVALAPFQPHDPQLLSYRQLLRQMLLKYQWQSTFSIDCSGPPRTQLWKVSFYLGSARIVESEWFSNKDAAKENAAMRALEWLNAYGYH
ncbi:hypothetical protein M408DRAFT_11801 [Serendipita vermifera MAFF 305830]|uniref:DRBM domain-containing protein n=1 Tax=Serendipita vermifera MAFF 305830 TaxID=933852 RepID=A0A0C3AE76_SERVB|nr:hypothetical protein M408DRAFT_11801 [Serendipita vermifera MAFF 305830]